VAADAVAAAPRERAAQACRCCCGAGYALHLAGSPSRRTAG